MKHNMKKYFNYHAIYTYHQSERLTKKEHSLNLTTCFVTNFIRISYSVRVNGSIERNNLLNFSAKEHNLGFGIKLKLFYNTT